MTLPVEVFRKKPVEVETILWDGTPERAEEIRAWTSESHHGAPMFLLPEDVQDDWDEARVFNDQEGCWIPCPVGHRVVKGRLGEFYPISPAAVAETYERVGFA